MKATIRTIAALAMFAFSAPAIAGGVNVYDDGESKLKIGGKIFSDLTSFKEKTGAAGTLSKQTFGARIERAYLTSKYYFNSDWMMRITTDVVLTNAISGGTLTPGTFTGTAPAGGGPVTGTVTAGTLTGNTVKKNNNIFLKYAYLEGKLYGKAAVLRLGQSHTPWIDYEQGLWKHRYFSKVLIDTNGYDASSDLGIGLKGKLLDGMAKYWVTYTNGRGYSHPGVVGKTMDLDSRLSLYPVKGLTLDFQLRSGYKGTKTFGAVNPVKNTLSQFMATYGSGHDYRVGLNYVTNKKRPTTGLSTRDKAIAVWGWTKLGAGFGVFGRYETTRNNLATVTKTNRFAGGIEYSPVKHVTLALAIDSKKTKVGGVTSKKSNRIGLWTQTKF